MSNIKWSQFKIAASYSGSHQSSPEPASELRRLFSDSPDIAHLTFTVSASNSCACLCLIRVQLSSFCQGRVLSPLTLCRNMNARG